MILRITFKSVDGSKNVSTLPYSSIDTLSILVNGDVASIDSEDEGAVASISIPLNNPEDTAEVTITATDEGYTYHNKFVVYGYDLGNNNTITTNPDFTIYLVKSSTIAFARFIAYRKPLSSEIMLYNASSASYSSTQYLNSNNTILSEIDNTIISSDPTIGVYMYQTYTYLSGGTYITVTDTNTVKELAKFKYLLDYNINIAYPFNTGDLTNPLASNTASIPISYNTLSKYRINDVERYPYNKEKFTYTLFSPSGTSVGSYNFTYTINNPPYVHVPTAVGRTYAFTTTLLGDYVLRVEKESLNYSDVSLNKRRKTKSVRSEQFYLVAQDYPNCSYTFTNKALPDAPLTGELFIDVYIYDSTVGSPLQFQTSTPLVNNVSVASQATYSIPITTDGIYQLRVKRPKVETPGTDYTNTDNWDVKYSLLINYCSALKCYENIQKKLICADNCDKCNDELNYDFNRIKSLFEIFTLYINSAQEKYKTINATYTIDKVHSIMENSTLSDFYTVQQIIERLGEYCARCRDEVVNPGDCGCS